ncbi:MAG: hypothetical protein LKJ60_13690 [Lentilactobacillus buchneri]|nr:hypothetical protein [Lentilactobacillus buchneri]
MNYLLQLRAFDDYRLYETKLSSGQTSLWYALMSINNKAHWQEWFTAANVVLERLSGLSRSGIVKNRNVLKQLGLIDFQSNGRKATSYRVCVLYTSDSTQRSVQDSTQESTQRSVQDSVQRSSALIKQNKTKQKPLRQKRAKHVYDQDSDYYKLAEFFVKKIRENNANFKTPNLQTWSDDFRKLIEIDKRNKHQVAMLIKWVQHDSFWASNVLSPSKLRKKFDQLAMKMDQDGSMGPSEPPVSKKPVYSDGEQRSIDIMQAFSTHDHDAEKATQALQAKYPDIVQEEVERQVYPEKFRKEDVF